MEREKNTDKQALPHSLSLQDRKKMAVSEKGKEAITHFKVLKRLVEDEIKSVL